MRTPLAAKSCPQSGPPGYGVRKSGRTSIDPRRIYSQIDWLPLSEGSVRPTPGRTLVVMQVSGSSQSFNAVNSLRVLGRWMRMITVPNQSSVPMAYKEFDDAGRMKPGPLYDRVVDVCEKLMKFTLLTRGSADDLADRYSERQEREP